MAENHFAEQAGTDKGLDRFAVLGFHADDALLSLRGCRSHCWLEVMQHVFECCTILAKTVGLRVPTWSQVNEAKAGLLGDKKTFEISI